MHSIKELFSGFIHAIIDYSEDFCLKKKLLYPKAFRSLHFRFQCAR